MAKVSKFAKRIKDNRNTVATLQKLVTDIAKDCDLDIERTARRIAAAKQHEYGPINGMINLVCAIAKWPAEPGDGANVPVNQLMLEEKYKLDLIMLEDLSSFKGYHTFCTNELEILEGVPPMEEEYVGYCQVFLNELGCKATIDPINMVAWERKETSARAKAQIDLEEKSRLVEQTKSDLLERM